MEREIVANGFHHMSWGTPVAQYFGLVGSSAGMFVIGSLGWAFRIQRYRQISYFTSNLALAQMAFVLFVLLFDLGQSARAANLFPLVTGFPHFTAPVAWGALLVGSYPVGLALYSYFIHTNNERWARIFGMLALFQAISTHWYTSVTLALNPSRSLNHTALAALLFMVGAFISGVGLLAIALKVRDWFVKHENRVDADMIVRLGRMMLVGVLINIFIIYSMVLHMAYGTQEEFHVLEIAATVFRAPVVDLYFFIGLVLPLAIFLSPYGKKVGGVLAASGLILLGTLGMRLGWVLISQFSQTFF